MNLLEAIKTGKPFRRKGWVNEIFILYVDKQFVEWQRPGEKSQWATSMCTSPTNFLEEDWEVQDIDIKMITFLREMTAVALKYDIIVCEPVEAAEHFYDPKYGPKLFWDTERRTYVAKTPTGWVRP